MTIKNNLIIIASRGDIWISAPSRANKNDDMRIKFVELMTPLNLYSPAYLEPRPLRYLETALVW